MSEGERVAKVMPESKKESRPYRVGKTDSAQHFGSFMDRMLFIQRTMGNRAVMSMLRSAAMQASQNKRQDGEMPEQVLPQEGDSAGPVIKARSGPISALRFGETVQRDKDPGATGANPQDNFDTRTFNEVYSKLTAIPPDYESAYYILNGLWIRDMIDVMKLLSRAGKLDDLAANIEVTKGKFGTARLQIAIDAVKNPTGSVTFSSEADVPKDQQEEVSAFLAVRDWPNKLSHIERANDEQITPVKGKTELKIPDVKKKQPGELTEQQRMIVDFIDRERGLIPTRLSDLKVHPYGKNPQAGYIYGGNPAGDPKPGAVASDPINQAIWTELGGEGGNSAINSYDEMILTWGKGFGAKGLLPEVMKRLPKTIIDALMDAGIAYFNGKWLVVNTDTGYVEEGDNALRLLQFNTTLLSLLINLATKYSQDFVDAQWKAIAGLAAAVPASARKWDVKTIRLVAHCIHWRTGRLWPDYVSTGGDIGAIVRIIAMQVGDVDAKRGGAIFLSQFQTSVLCSFAEGLARSGMGNAAPLPADIKENSYAGHIFFQSDANNYYHLSP